MSWSPFASVSDYPTMLKKIAIFTFGVSVILVELLRRLLPDIDKALSFVVQSVPIEGVKVPLATVLVALVIGFVSRVFKVHDRLSDLFGIRRRFDIAYILLPMSTAAGGVHSVDTIRKIKDERKRLMGPIFYRYVSSTAGRAAIDTHYITMAMDQWTWYWILLEAIALVFLTGVIFLFFGKGALGALSFLLVLILQWPLLAIRKLCERYALEEIEQVLLDKTRKAAIKEIFDAL